MSTSPLVPKPAAAAPVRASSARSRRPDVSRIRGAAVPSPAQYARPRRDGAPPAIGDCQTGVPVSGSSATTRLAAGRYITPPTTIGVTCELTAAAAPPRPPPAPAGGGASL